MMAYKHKNAKGTTYVLHAKERKLKSGKTQTLYYFAKTEGPDALDSIPAGYVVSESANGLPFLKKK
jgi:hypothetical protein